MARNDKENEMSQKVVHWGLLNWLDQPATACSKKAFGPGIGEKQVTTDVDAVTCKACRNSHIYWAAVRSR